MIFTRDLILKIQRGEKTETRRIWKRPHVRVGGVYSVRRNRFSPVYPPDPKVRVLSMRKERLGLIDEAGSIAEGCAGKSDFISLWTHLHGAWNPETEVTVVRFEVVRSSHYVPVEVEA